MGNKILSIACDTNLVTKRGHNQVMNQVMRDAAEHHRDKVLPGHFEESAYRKYHYKPRTRGYTQAKLKKVGHTLPLVYTGELLALALRSQVTATKDRSRVIIRGHFPMKDEIREELEAFLESEKEAFVKRSTQQYLQRIKDPRYARKRK